MLFLDSVTTPHFSSALSLPSNSTRNQPLSTFFSPKHLEYSLLFVCLETLPNSSQICSAMGNPHIIVQTQTIFNMDLYSIENQRQLFVTLFITNIHKISKLLVPTVNYCKHQIMDWLSSLKFGIIFLSHFLLLNFYLLSICTSHLPSDFPVLFIFIIFLSVSHSSFLSCSLYLFLISLPFLSFSLLFPFSFFSLLFPLSSFSLSLPFPSLFLLLFSLPFSSFSPPNSPPFPH